MTKTGIALILTIVFAVACGKKPDDAAGDDEVKKGAGESPAGAKKSEQKPPAKDTKAAPKKETPPQEAKLSDIEEWPATYVEKPSGSWKKVVDAPPSSPASRRPQIFYDIAFPSAKRGFVFHDQAMIATGDAGKSWKAHKEYEGLMTEMEVVSESLTFAVRADRALVHSTDGGNSWLAIESKMRPKTERLFFADAKIGFLLGRDKLSRTDDGGKSWSGSFMPSYSFFKDMQVGPDGGWLLGEQKNQLTVWQSKGLERSKWRPVLKVTEGGRGPRHGLAALGNTVWWTANDAVLMTADGGTTWKRMTGGPADARYWDVHFSDASNGWLLGSAGAPGKEKAFILHTTDGGKSWVAQIVKLSRGEELHRFRAAGDRLFALGMAVYELQSAK